MNKLVIGVLSFVVGAAAGAVGGYFVTKKIVKKQSEIYIQQEIDTALADLKDKKPKAEPVEEKDEVEKMCDDIRERHNKAIKENTPADRAKYREYADGYSPTPFDPDDPKVIEALAKSRVDSDNPFIITEDEFGENNYDTVNLYYHPTADDITDDDGHLNDPDETVGSKLFNKFAADQEVDEIFVRNPYLMIDFHLQKEFLK